MQKILVIGSPGSGKSTFSRALSALTGISLCYLDLLWHLPDRTTVSEEEFDRRLSDVLKGERWIIDGNYLRTLEVRLQSCDTVFLLDYPVEICLAGVRQRIGRKREDMPWVEQSFDPEFRQWILDFPHAQLPGIRTLLLQYAPGRQITVFRSRAECTEWLERFGDRENCRNRKIQEDNIWMKNAMRC